jgi:DNA-binding SARP family transcriptional activator
MASEAAQPALRFRILGPIRAWRDGLELDLGPRQRHLILALLLVNDGRPVDLAELVALLWADDPPPSAVNVVHRYIGGLRRLLEPELPNRASGDWLQRSGVGYRLDASGAAFDLREARALAAEGHRLAGADDEAAVAAYAAALDLWDDRCGTGLAGVCGIHPAFVAVDHEGSSVARAAADVAVRGELSALILPALRRAATRDPFDEALQARLLLALAADGRQAEALAGFQTVRRNLAAELGVEPGRELLDAHRRILEQEESPPPVSTAESVPLSVAPAQLPTDLATFTGRRNEITNLDAALRDPEHKGRAAVVVTIDGMPGVGKSTLALHWAHRVAGRFPDGQLFLDLHGFEPEGKPTSPRDALGNLLTGLGVVPAQMPGDLDARAGLYRSLLAERRVLIVLDNAHTTDQVIPLLPSGPGSVAVVTSRHRLTGLALRGAHPLTVGLPSFQDARESLRARVGDRRADAEPDAVDDIIAHCARLPLALAVVGARAHSNPTFSLAAIADDLHTARGRLDGLDDDLSGSVRHVFSWSYRQFSEPAARMLRLLSLHHGGEISTAAAASLAAVPPRLARELADELCRGRLLLERQPGRYVMHDLMRAYAREQADEYESPDALESARARLLAHYALTAQRAQQWLDRRAAEEPEISVDQAITAEPIGDHRAALSALARISSIVADQVRSSHAGDLGDV